MNYAKLALERGARGAPMRHVDPKLVRPWLEEAERRARLEARERARQEKIDAERAEVRLALQASIAALSKLVKPTDNEAMIETATRAMERIPIRIFVTLVSKITGVAVVDIRSARRDYDVVKARHITAWVVKHFTTHSLPSIGAALGGRDHTTVLHAARRVQRVVDRIGFPEIETPETVIESLWRANWKVCDGRVK